MNLLSPARMSFPIRARYYFSHGMISFRIHILIKEEWKCIYLANVGAIRSPEWEYKYARSRYFVLNIPMQSPSESDYLDFARNLLRICSALEEALQKAPFAEQDFLSDTDLYPRLRTFPAQPTSIKREKMASPSQSELREIFDKQDQSNNVEN